MTSHKSSCGNTSKELLSKKYLPQTIENWEQHTPACWTISWQCMTASAVKGWFVGSSIGCLPNRIAQSTLAPHLPCLSMYKYILNWQSSQFFGLGAMRPLNFCICGVFRWQGWKKARLASRDFTSWKIPTYTTCDLKQSWKSWSSHNWGQC